MVDMDHAVDARIDVTGVCCPLPLIELAKAVSHLNPGQTVEVKGNDPIFESSVRDFCSANGHVVVSASPGDNDSVVMLLQVGG
jgi:tRNA 2-thiouridine synthesizing protein A